ncbi:MAG: right-handed parallel beta-helix repeat-containing protein [Candidatus Rokubacteria bacterium]|nr:right-handed parallel beta-helix repeat-containing protein [Candidatus Rokubacteria bacterium]
MVGGRGSSAHRLLVLLLGGLLVGASLVPPALAAPLPGFPLQSSQASPVTGAVTISAPSILPEPGLLGVQFKVDGYVLDALDATAPFQVVWSAASATNGDHTITAEVRLTSGIVIESAPLSLTVDNPSTFNRTLHVDATAGNDGNNGLTPDTAWRTLDRANNAVVAGDTVLLWGTFTGQYIRPAISGTPATPITFRSAPGQTAVLDGGLSGVAARLTARSYIVVEQLRIQNVPGQAVVLEAGAHHNVLRDLLITDIINGTAWVSAIRITQSSDNLIERNTITNIGNATADQGDSMWIDNGSSRNRILSNTMRNGSHSLILIGGDSPGDAEVGDNVVAGNTLSNPWGSHIGLLHMARRTLIEGNRLSDANVNGTNRTSATIQVVSRDHIIRYNEFVNNGAINAAPGAGGTPGISLLAYTYTAGVEQDAIGNRIYHNVFYGNGTYGLWMSEKGGRRVTNNVIENNIFFRNAGFPLGSQTYTIGIEHYSNPTAWPVGSLNGNRIQNNILLRQPGSAGEPMVLRIRNASQGGNLTYTLSAFQQTYTEAANNLEADPLFTDAVSGVFTLRAGSPAVDAGLIIPGIAYLGAAPDLGAYEYGAGGPTPAAPSGLSLR